MLSLHEGVDYLFVRMVERPYSNTRNDPLTNCPLPLVASGSQHPREPFRILVRQSQLPEFAVVLSVVQYPML